MKLGELEKLKVNPDWAKLPLFDRSKWQRVRFGDVVGNLNETCDPAEAGIERFIGLEHLEPGSLHIRTWGDVADGTTFTRRARPRQVLFGKRRAYQRKVAVTVFDAVVSGDIYVLAPKGDRLLLDLLPFLCQSERFFQHAVGTSAGSLSPRTNWSSLASFEFELPPLVQQQMIEQIFWQIDANAQASSALLASIKQARQALIVDFVRIHSTSSQRLGDYLGEVQYGSSSKADAQPKPVSLPVLGIPNVIGGIIDYSKLAWLELTAEQRKFLLRIGDVLIVRTNGNPDYVGRTAVYGGGRHDECLYASYLIRLRTKSNLLNPTYLHEMLQAPTIKREVRKQVRSSAGNYNLNTDGIRRLAIPIPSMREQESLLTRLNELGAPRISVLATLDANVKVRTEFLNQVCGV